MLQEITDERFSFQAGELPVKKTSFGTKLSSLIVREVQKVYIIFAQL